MQKLSLYQQDIKAYTGCTDAQAPCVEEFMRTETGGCLDGLSADEFKKMARRWYREIRDMEEEALSDEQMRDLLAFSNHGDYTEFKREFV